MHFKGLYRSKYSLNKGFTLVEILVALLLVSIGFLGMLGMQSFSLQQSQDTYFANKANYLARELADKVRLNSSVVSDYAVDTSTAPSSITNCTNSNCSSTQMADYDKAIWADSVKKLPNGRGVVTFDAAEPNSLQILISWKEKESNLTSSLPSVSLCNGGNGSPSGVRCVVLKVYI